jgi:hypothetical protein
MIPANHAYHKLETLPHACRLRRAGLRARWCTARAVGFYEGMIINTMKKIGCSIAIIATLGISSSSHAQKLMLGLRGGIDFATVAWDSAAQFAKKGTSNGLIAGGQLDVWFNDHVALSTGLLLDQKGWRVESDNPGNYNNYTLDYLEIPIFLKVAFGTGNFQPYLFAGPSIGFMVLGYTNQFQTYDPTLANENTLNINHLLNTVDFSVVGGAAVT